MTPLAAALALAAAAAGPAAPPLRAAPLVGRIVVDGRLDDAGWNAAERFGDFVTIAPVAGGVPRERTEVRVLYGPRTLYVGIRCHDREPGGIVRPMGRRDHPARSDSVVILVDADHDHRTATLLSLTAGGVRSDALVYDDDRVTFDWDAVWEGAATVDAGGWTAELAIPTSSLGGPLAPQPSWGFGVIREVARTHERSGTFALPGGARGLTSRLGDLEELRALDAPAAFAFNPYLATRVVVRPRGGDAGGSRARLVDGMGDLGLDLRGRLGAFTLAGALNPDFGQVEADRIVRNLTSFETFFPEKRPFFTEGLDLFQPVGAGDERVPQQLFYSRRIGLGAPILAAAKVVGRAGEDVRVGFLDVLVAGTGRGGASEEAPSRALRWSPSQPLRVAPADAYPAAAPGAENRLATVVRWRAAPGLVLGAQLTSALPLGAPCAPEDASAANPPASCRSPGGNAFGADLDAVSSDAEWYAYGLVVASRAAGGPPERILADGTALRRGDAGLGGHLRAGRRGGEPWRFDVGFSHASPRLDLNASGFQRTQNEQELRARLSFVRPGAHGPFDDLEAYASALSRWTTDGRGLVRGRSATLGLDASLARTHLATGCSMTSSGARDDVREIAATGIPLRMPGALAASCEVSTDPARAASGRLELHASRAGEAAGFWRPWSSGAALGLALRPHPRAETRVALALDRAALPLRHVGDGADGALLFAAQDARSLSVLVSQLWVVTRDLTVQAHAQLFTAYERYGRFLSAEPRGADVIRPGDLRPAPAPAADPGGRTAALVVDAVLRWEYRPGSTVFLVYSRNQASADTAEGHTLAPAGLARGPVTDALLVKWTWWTGV